MSDEQKQSKIDFEALAKPMSLNNRTNMNVQAGVLYRIRWDIGQRSTPEYRDLWSTKSDLYDQAYFKSVGLDPKDDDLALDGRSLDNRIKYDRKRRVR